jgi:hypothetical protein
MYQAEKSFVLFKIYNSARKDLSPEGHTTLVHSVAFSPDRRTAIFATYQGLKLWDLTTGKLLRTFEGHTENEISVVFSPDGRAALSCSHGNAVDACDATAELADRDRGQPVRFTAYAFNEDRLKSETASDESYKVPDDVAQAKPRAYVIAIGVNSYDNPEWKLGYAVKDALDLSGALKSIEGYEVVSVPLVSGEKDGAKLDEATSKTSPTRLRCWAGMRRPGSG